MQELTLNSEANAVLTGLSGPVVIVDEQGRRLGRFVPALFFPESDGSPYSSEQLARMYSAEGGRTLAEIWRSVGAK